MASTDATNQFEYRFSTKPQDSATGLLYYGYRWYDPLTGRWPSRDPIGEKGGENLYAFVGNDGVGKADLLGLAEVQYHHWLMNAPSLRARLAGICPGLEPDDYTTPYPPGNNRKGTPHHMIHHLIQNAALVGYHAAYLALLSSVNMLPPPLDKYKCCAMLLGVETLKNGAHQLVQDAFGTTDGDTKAWTPPLFTYPRNGNLPVSTDDKWSSEMLERCNCVPEDERFRLWELVTRPLRGIPKVGVEPPPSVVPSLEPVIPYVLPPLPPLKIPEAPPVLPQELFEPTPEELRKIALVAGTVVVIGGVAYLVVSSGGALAPVLIPLTVAAH